MPKKLNSFILSDSLIQKMKTGVEKAKTINKEVGFLLCSDNEELHDDSQCIGNECELAMPLTCSKGRKVGSFHAHTESTDPSIRDIYDTYKFGIGCIGSTEQKKIKCHIRKDKTPKPEDIEIIRSSIEKFEEPLFVRSEIDTKSYWEWIRIRGRLRRQYLDTVDIV